MGCSQSKPAVTGITGATHQHPLQPLFRRGDAAEKKRSLQGESSCSRDYFDESVHDRQQRASLRNRSFRSSESAVDAITRGDEGIRVAGLASDWDVGQVGKALKGNRNVRRLCVEMDFNEDCGPKAVQELFLGIKHCPSLEEVHLIGTGDQGAKALGELLLKDKRRRSFSDLELSRSKLRIVRLSSGSRISESSAKILGKAIRNGSATGIKALHLPSNNIGDAEVSCLAEELFMPRQNRPSTLQHSATMLMGSRCAVSPRNDTVNRPALSPSMTGWGPGDLPLKKRSSSLSRFDLSSRLPRRKASSSLSLHMLDLSRNNISDQGCRVLAETLEMKAAVVAEGAFSPKSKSAGVHTVLDTLILRHNHIQNIEPITNLFFLKELRLGYNQIGHDVNNMYALSDLLRFGQLEVLDLEGNHIDDEGAQILAEGLRRATRLKQLLLSHNPLRNEGVRALCQAMPNTVQILELRNCGLDHEVAPAMVHMLSRMTRIRQLVVSENAFGNLGLKELVQQGIKCNSHLERFLCERDHGEISDPDATNDVLDAIRSHPALRQLSLHGNPGISSASLESISRVIISLNTTKVKVLTALCSVLKTPSFHDADQGNTQEVLYYPRTKHDDSPLKMLPVNIIKLVAAMLYE